MEKNNFEKVSLGATNWDDLRYEARNQKSMPKLPEVKHQSLTTFSELMPHLPVYFGIFTEQEFDVFIPMSDIAHMKYICQFANPEKAEKHYTEALNAEDEETFNAHNDELANCIVYVLDVSMEQID